MKSLTVETLLMLTLLYAIVVKCSNSRCYEKCLANTTSEYANNIHIYLKYKKAVLKVPGVRKTTPSRIYKFSQGEIIPGMPNYDTQRLTFFWKRKVRGIVAKSNEVMLRGLQIDPQEVACSSSEARRTRKAVKCKPRPYVLDLESAEGQIIPDQVLTQQCSGFCNKNIKIPKTCTSVKSENVSVSVQVVRKDGSIYCSSILIPKDLKCKCQCAIRPESCTSKQRFSKKTCSCNCRKEEEDRCNAQIGQEKKRNRGTNIHHWDSNSCSCICLAKSNCTTGFIWNETICRCLAIKKENYG